MSEEVQNETIVDKAKAKFDALKTKEGRDALKGKAKECWSYIITIVKGWFKSRKELKERVKSFWENSAIGKVVCIGCFAILLLLIFLPFMKTKVGKAEIEFVKRSSFENNSLVPIGVALERNSKTVTWQFKESDAGIKYVEATGEFNDKGRLYCLTHYGSDNNMDFYKLIPELAELLWKHKETNRAFWNGGFAMLPDISRISRFLTAVKEIPKGKEVLGEYNGDRIYYNAEFKAAHNALERALRVEKETGVLFMIQFPMPVSNYDSSGKFNGEKAVCKQGYSAVMFTKGPLAGQKIKCDLLPIVK